MASFSQYSLHEEIQHNLLSFGFSEPTEVQQEVIPAALAGGDVMAAAPTGTGKSAAFLLPIMNKIITERRATGDGNIRALIVAPTRELVVQTRDFLLNFQATLKLRVTTIYGGTGISPQIQELRSGTDIVIATPGRVVDLIDRGEIVASSVDQFVLDEMDRMVEMGFVHDINTIIKSLHDQCQLMFFSATITRAAAKVAGQALRRPTLIDLSGSLDTLTIPDSVACSVLFVEKSHKRKLFQWLLSDLSFKKVLIFVPNKAEAERLAKSATTSGVTCGTVYGEKSNAARMQVVEQFAHGKLNVLIATDILSRGIDVIDLTHVINYNVPRKLEPFVHRIGRTGRAGNNGVALTLCDQDDRAAFYRINQQVGGITIEVMDWHPFHSDKVQEMTFEEALEKVKKGRSSATLSEKQAERKEKKRVENVQKQEEAARKKAVNRQKKKKDLEAKYGKKLTGKGRHKGLSNKAKRKRK